MEFSPEDLKKTLEEFDFPRAIGSEGNKIATQKAHNLFESMGYSPDLNEFHCNHFYSVWFLRIVLASIISLSICAQILLDGSNWYIFVIILGFLLWFIMFVSKNHDKAIWGKKLKQSNIIAHLPSETEDTAHQIIICAHIDTKSQKFTIIQRAYWISIVVILIWIIFPTYLFLLLINKFIGNPVNTSIVFWVLMADLFIFLLFICLNSSGNESHGAMDDGTGIVLVLALADYFKENPLDNTEIWFCLFNCEEFGQIGVINWLKMVRAQLDLNTTLIINIDMPATSRDNGVVIYKTKGLIKQRDICPSGVEILEKVAQAEKIPLEFSKIVVGKMDSIPFRKSGFKAIDIGSDAAIGWGHSTEDCIENVSFPILSENCRLIAYTLQNINSQ